MAKAAQSSTTKKTATPKRSTTVRKTTTTRARSKTVKAPTEEQIRHRAFEIYQRRNGAPGDATSDWHQAEVELRSELAPK